ncbi:MAG TPA: PKD domain-containing protein [Saprospiraceae bacterium]|nr:PKD domain-containing protein [Saprospiraceae bacterium]
MKNLFIVCMLLVCGATVSFAQNLVGNPGFETVTNPTSSISKFNLEQVSRWKCIADANEVRTEYYCSGGGIPITPNSGSRMALLDASYLGFGGPFDPPFNVSFPLTNLLTRPIFPGEKLTIQYAGLIPAFPCAYYQSYFIDFYVSNQLPTSPFLLNGFTKIGTSFIQQASSWTTVQAQGLDGTNNVQVPANTTCSFKYLILQVRGVMLAASPGSESQERLVPPKIILLDDVSVQPACSSSIDVNITPMDDFGGQCNDVRFAASITNGTAVRFFWDFGDGSTLCSTSGLTVHSYPNMGDYTAKLTVLDANGCTRVITIPVVVECERCEGISASLSAACQGCQQSYIINPNTGQPTSYNIDCTYNLYGNGTPGAPGLPLNYQWVFNGGTVSTAQNPTNAHLILVGNNLPLNAALCLSVMDNQGCKATTCETMTLPCSINSDGKMAADPDGSFLVVPNPSTSSAVNLVLPVSWIGQSLNLSIHDMSGRLMEQRQLDGSDSDLRLDLSNLDNGVYFFTIRHAEGQVTKKVVIQN